MRLIDADALLEILTIIQSDYPISDRSEFAKATRNNLFDIKRIIDAQPTIKTCSASSSCSMYMEDDD